MASRALAMNARSSSVSEPSVSPKKKPRVRGRVRGRAAEGGECVAKKGAASAY